jgi:hypothetical protein
MLPGQFSGNGDWIATTDARTLAWQLVNPEQEVAASRRNIAVCIKNASSDKLLASKLAAALRRLGYSTSIGRDEKDSIYKTTRIIVQNGNIANGNMMHADLGNIGEVVPASVGDLYSKITIFACDDIKLDAVSLSSASKKLNSLDDEQPLQADSNGVNQSSEGAQIISLPEDIKRDSLGSENTANDRSATVGDGSNSASGNSSWSDAVEAQSGHSKPAEGSHDRTRSSAVDFSSNSAPVPGQQEGSDNSSAPNLNR